MAPDFFSGRDGHFVGVRGHEGSDRENPLALSLVPADHERPAPAGAAARSPDTREDEVPPSGPVGLDDAWGMDRFGEYRVRRLIGEGGMGKVYEAEERLSRRRVALKVMHPELAKSEHARKLFLNEMQILAHLEHANIVRSLASIEVDGELVMVLEFLEGKTLRRLLVERGKLPWRDALTVVTATAAALAAAHGQEPPIIHRDLKPENIMVCGARTVKVMDFGIAKVVEALNQTNTQSIGTLQYMSPEQIDAHVIDHRADLYCLGLVFYELVAGKPPFTSGSPRQLLNLQCTAEPPPLPDDVREGMPKEVEELIFQLLEKAPEDRPYLAEDVIERLEPHMPEDPAPLTDIPESPARERGQYRSPRGGVRGRPSGGGRDSRDGGDDPPRKSAEPARSARDEASGRESPRGGLDARGDGERRGAERGADRGAAGRDDARRDDARREPRADTIALVERAAAPREIPRRAALAIVVALSVLAGLGAYLARASRTPEAAAPSATTAPLAQPNASGGAPRRP